MSFPPYQNPGIGPIQAMSDQNANETLMANGGQMFASGGIAMLADGGLNALPKYKYDPKTQRYTLADAEAAPKAGGLENLIARSGSASGGDSVPSSWSSMTNAEKAAYYADNPTMGKLARGLQAGLGMTGLGAVAKYLNPQGWGEADAISRGFDPSQTSFGRESALFGLLPGREAVPQPGVDAYGYGASGYGFANPMQVEGGTQGPLSGAAFGEAAPNLAGLGSGYEGMGGAGMYNTSTYNSYNPSDSSDGSESGGGVGAAQGGLMALAGGGMSHLGDYSDGGRLLRGPGDGVSDDIPATIGDKRPARLADGEFVVPARIVSELGNGSTEAGARQLYAMMDRIQKARGKTVGKDNVAVDSRAAKHLPV
jgi:hypothetical protein